MSHTPYADKYQAPGFGPYILHSPAREDRNVQSMTAAVFDVDQRNEYPSRTLELLTAASITHVLYSSYSHNPPTKHAYRLVIPLAQPLDPNHWSSFRQATINRFEIPCDPKQCSGKSHFYFLPSCPPNTTPLAHYSPGNPLEISTPVLTTPTPPPTHANDTRPMEASHTLEELITKLRRKATPTNPRTPLINAIIQGNPLANHGARNNTTLIATGLLAYSLPTSTPTEQLLAIITPSIEAMRRDGSSITLSEVRSMIVRACNRKAAEEEKFFAQLTNLRNNAAGW